jgi:hypothetical protein
MRTLPLLLPLLAAVACDPSMLEVGHATACLAGDLPENLFEYDGDNLLFEIEGSVISDEAGAMPETAMECYWTIDRVLTIEDTEGVLWSVGYGVEDPDGNADTPALDVEEGEAVSLVYRSVQSFGAANGFVLEDDDGLVAALESGTWGPALEDGDVPGLAVTSGDMIGTQDSECGTEGHFAWSFAGDDTVEVDPYGQDTVTIAGAPYTAMAVANLQWQGDVQCTDLAGDEVWAVFR